MNPLTTDASLPSGQEPDRGSKARSVDTLNRFLGGLVQESWDDLDRALRITQSSPDFSGIVPLGDPGLKPFLNKPGIFFIMGPQPELRLLHVGASRGPIGFVLRSRIEKTPEGRFTWRWEAPSDHPPTFAAVATMEDYWAFAPPLRNLLVKRLCDAFPEIEDEGGGVTEVPGGLIQ
jgi:hypothetical protein